MMGNNKTEPEPGDGDSGSDPTDSGDDDLTSSDSEEETKTAKPSGKSLPRESNSFNDLEIDFLALKPELDHNSNSADVKRLKRRSRREYQARLNLLKYQQNFIKNEPPFTYNGDANTTTFKNGLEKYETGQSMLTFLLVRAYE